jgi:hypothetical protein
MTYPALPFCCSTFLSFVLNRPHASLWRTTGHVQPLHINSQLFSIGLTGVCASTLCTTARDS